MALTDDLIDSIAAKHWFFSYVAQELMRQIARAIESAACAERDARIAELEKRVQELVSGVARADTRITTLNEENLLFERQLHEQAVSLAEAYNKGWDACQATHDGP